MPNQISRNQKPVSRSELGLRVQKERRGSGKTWCPERSQCTITAFAVIRPPLFWPPSKVPCCLKYREARQASPLVRAQPSHFPRRWRQYGVRSKVSLVASLCPRYSDVVLSCCLSSLLRHYHSLVGWCRIQFMLGLPLVQSIDGT